MGTGLPMVLFRWTLVKGAPLMLLVVLLPDMGSPGRPTPSWNATGARARCIAQASTYKWLNSTSLNSVA